MLNGVRENNICFIIRVYSYALSVYDVLKCIVRYTDEKFQVKKKIGDGMDRSFSVYL